MVSCCECDADFPAAPTPSLPARDAAREIAAWIFGLENPLTSELDLSVTQGRVEQIISKYSPAAAETVGEQWQPIETAPKNRTILLAGKGLEGWLQMTGYWAETDWYFIGGGWMGVPPTRWMSLHDPNDSTST